MKDCCLEVVEKRRPIPRSPELCGSHLAVFKKSTGHFKITEEALFYKLALLNQAVVAPPP